jgi:hypothetical protein
MDDKLKDQKPAVQIDINLDKTPILYTDNIYMTTNEDGLVLDFTQKLGPTNRLRIVSRIGMSRQHAKKFLSELSRLVAMTDGQLQTNKTKN